MSSDIKAYMHCGTCFKKNRRDRVQAGLVDHFTLRIWCGKCDKLVADFTLAKPIQPRCDVCGEAIGPDHHH